MKKLNVAIIGTGNIGTDLLFKVRDSKILEPVFFVGRNPESKGLNIGKNLGVATSSGGISFLAENDSYFDCVFDATSGASHILHNSILGKKGKDIINLTPAKCGIFCVPPVNLEACFKEANINMVTCGGQATLPLAYAFKMSIESIDYLEIVSSISSESAGIATRENIDEYLTTTETALKYFSGAKKSKAILNINPAKPNVLMQTTIYVYARHIDFEKVLKQVNAMEQRIVKYVPGYKIVLYYLRGPNQIVLSVIVRGKGDYLPEYSGNLDIINCAAIAAAEYKCH